MSGPSLSGSAGTPLLGAASLAPGQLVGERFRVEHLAGAGGMGEVYRAVDTTSGGAVAIKITRQTVEDEARFVREASLLEALSDPAVVRYVGHGRLTDGRPYLAMEWLEGESLSDRIARGLLDASEAIAVVRAVARALGAAHRRGIVHRDVKPSNVFVVAGEAPIGARVRLIDFGIARHTVLRGATVTKTDAAIGTPHYMAPEQVRGARGVGAAADVFSLGCLLYECLVGRSPFVSDTLLAALAAVLLEDPEPPRKLVPAISPELERLVLRMLAKDPAQRPADGDAVAQALDEVERLTQRVSSIAPPTLAGLSHREQRLTLVLVALPSEEQRATDATQRADEPDPTTLKLRSIVEQSEGRVELSAEGALVASFSGEGATRDRVARALRCARRLVGSDARVRVGLVAGRAVRGRVPVAEAVERAIQVARRAGSSEGWGGIGLDEDLASFADEPRTVTQAVRTSHAPAPGAEGGGATLHGRDRELRALFGSVEEALAEPIARAVVIEAEAGLGKTAVLETLLAQLEALALGDEGDAPRALEVRLHAGDHEAPLSLLVRLVRAAAHIEEGEPIEVRRDKLAAHVAGLGPEEAGLERAGFLRDLGDLARVPTTDGLRDEVVRGDRFLRGDLERRAFAQWIALVARTPTVLAIDDAHHADPSSLELLDQALETLSDRPLVLLATARPSDEGQGLGRSLPRSEAETQRLGPLLPRAARALVDALADDAEAEARAAIVAAGEGNPFFLRELCAARTRGADAPASILAAIEERILRVPEQTRRVLRASALLREPSALDAIGELVPGLGEADVRARLEELVRAELVAGDARGRALYAPRSSLVADAAYAMIPDDDRRIAHRLAGLALRARGAEPARVATHLARGAEPVLAADAYREAAERALEAHDLVRARAHAEHGLALVPAERAELALVRAELLLRRAEAARWAGAYADAEEDARAALAILAPVRSRDHATSERFLEALGVALVAASALAHTTLDDTPARPSPWALAATLLTSPCAPPEDRELVALEVVALCRAAASFLGRGAREEAQAWLGVARTRAGEAPAALASAWLATLDASAALHAGELARFLDGTERAVREYERAGDARNACNQRVRLSNALVSVGELERAEQALSAAAADAERMGLAVIAGYALQNLGHVRARLGKTSDARGLLLEALARADKLGDGRLRAGVQLYLALLELSGGDAADALRHAASARAALSSGAFLAIAQAIEARALLALGRLPDAEAASAAASGWLAAHGPIEEGEATIHRAQADVLDAIGRHDEAVAVAARAYAAIAARASALTPSLATGYLERHPDHVRLAALARESTREAT